MSGHFPAEVGLQLALDYHLDAKPATPAEGIASLSAFCGDAEFSLPLYEIINNWRNGDAFYFRMRFVNPFSGSFAGTAHHGVDLLFAFQTYNKLLPQALAAAAEEMGKHLIRFCHGLSPWPRYNEETTVMCYGPDTVKALAKKDDKVGRYEIWDRLRGIQDAWTRASRELRNERIYS